MFLIGVMIFMRFLFIVILMLRLLNLFLVWVCMLVVWLVFMKFECGLSEDSMLLMVVLISFFLFGGVIYCV